MEVNELTLDLHVVQCLTDELLVLEQILQFAEGASLHEQITDFTEVIPSLVAIALHVVNGQHHPHRLDALVEIDCHLQHLLGS